LLEATINKLKEKIYIIKGSNHVIYIGKKEEEIYDFSFETIFVLIKNNNQIRINEDKVN
jgi:hypothetical protein